LSSTVALIIKMADKTTEKIEKPWAVYGWFLGAWDIGKIVKDSKDTCYIQYSERQQYSPECWDKDWVHVFDNPVKAMAYFRVHVHDSDYTQEKVAERFLISFPSERANLERLLPKRFAQRQSSCMETVLGQRDEGPFGPHTHRKDDGFVHPNKRY
jgi:hypothetical protein